MTTTATQPAVLFEQQERVGLITLNRPERLNAWTREMARMLQEYIDRCNADDGIGAIVLTGAGRGFCSGADLRPEPAADGAAPRPYYLDEPLPLFLARSKPIICAVNGAAVGAGLTLPLACDIRIASEQARFSMRFVRIGLTPEWCSTFNLPQIVGLGQAAELILSGRIIDAAEAGRIGLVNRVVPHDQLLPVALALAAEIAANPTDQVRWAKRLLRSNAANANLPAVNEAEMDIFMQAMRSDAFAEAGRAFAEKRDPNYHGKA